MPVFIIAFFQVQKIEQTVNFRTANIFYLPAAPVLINGKVTLVFGSR
jgi:hypothetical protein